MPNQALLDELNTKLVEFRGLEQHTENMIEAKKQAKEQLIFHSDAMSDYHITEADTRFLILQGDQKYFPPFEAIIFANFH
jgi:hypothetical protein